MAEFELLVEVGSLLRAEKNGFGSADWTGDGFAHRRTKTQGLCSRKRTVVSTPSRIDSFGAQPNARIFLQSRKMNGLSPIQPRSPPVYSRRGLTPIAAQIQPIESLTSQ